MNGLFLAPYFGKLMMLGFSGFYAWLSGNFAQKAFGMDDAAFSLFGVELWSAWQIWIIAIIVAIIAFVVQILTLDAPKAEEEKTVGIVKKIRKSDI